MIIGASEFKAKCLSLIDDVGRTGERIVISKRGKPIAELIRYMDVEHVLYPQESLRDTVRFIDDIVEPAVPSDDWNSIA